MEQRIKALNYLIIGWVNYFGLADMKGSVKELDEWIRRRLRMCIWKQWLAEVEAPWPERGEESRQRSLLRADTAPRRTSGFNRSLN